MTRPLLIAAILACCMGTKSACIPEKAVVGVERGAVEITPEIVTKADIEAVVRAAIADFSTNLSAGRDINTVESEVAKILAKQAGWREWKSTVQAGLWIVAYLILHRVSFIRKIFDATKGKSCRSPS